MEKSTHTPHYRLLRQRLKDLRGSLGLSQRKLAERLKAQHSLVEKVETGERRLDLIELFWFCQALRVDPEGIAAGLFKEFRKLEATPERKPKKRRRGR